MGKGKLSRRPARSLRALFPGWVIRNAAHLSALWAVAVVQPTLEVLGENADLFVARQVEGWGLVTVLVTLAVLPPVLLALIERMAEPVSERLRVWVHPFFVWALLSLFSLYVLRQLLPDQGSGLIVVAWVAGAAGLVLYTRTQAAGSFLTVLSPASLLFVLYFLFLSPSHKLVFPEHVEAAGVSASRTPVVMLMLDELPVSSLMDARGRIDAKLFPNFAALANGSTWYRNTTTAGDFTEDAVPAVLTGQHARAEDLAVLRDHPENLFTLLGKSHRLEAMEHISWLCPPELCPNETPAFERMRGTASALSAVYARVIAPPSLVDRLPLVGSTWKESRDAKDPKRRVDANSSGPELARHGEAQFERFLRELEPAAGDDGRPSLNFLHSALPHVPWKHGASGRLYTGHFEGLPGLHGDGQIWDRNRTLVEHGLQRHLLQAKFCDLLLGRMLRRLQQLGTYERSLIVVTADHGASFVPGGRRRLVDRGNAGDVGLIPFFLKAPRQRHPRVVDAHIQSTDVLPTLTEELGVRIPWRVDGRAPPELPEQGRRRLRIFRFEEGSRTFPAALLERHRRRSVRHKLSLFGSGTGLAGLYGWGPDRDLLGRELAGLRPRRGSGVVQLEKAEEFLSVDPSSPYVPALAAGTVPGNVASVVVAVNGRVEGVAPTHGSGEARRFSVLFREGSLRAGRNRVEVFAASGRGSSRRLTSLRRAG